MLAPVEEFPRNDCHRWQEPCEETRDLRLQAMAVRANLAVAAFGLLEARTHATRTLEASQRLRLLMSIDQQRTERRSGG